MDSKLNTEYCVLWFKQHLQFKNLWCLLQYLFWTIKEAAEKGRASFAMARKRIIIQVYAFVLCHLVSTLTSSSKQFWPQTCPFSDTSWLLCFQKNPLEMNKYPGVPLLLPKKHLRRTQDCVFKKAKNVPGMSFSSSVTEDKEKRTKNGHFAETQQSFTFIYP